MKQCKGMLNLHKERQIEAKMQKHLNYKNRKMVNKTYSSEERGQVSRMCDYSKLFMQTSNSNETLTKSAIK